MKNLPWMCTNADTLTNKMPELIAYMEHDKPWITTVAEIIPKNYQIPVQKAELIISNNSDIFPECISRKGRGIKIQILRNLNAHQVGGQVANQWNRLPAGVVGAPSLTDFKRRLITTIKEREWKFNFKSDCSLIVN